ncbi:MAG: hypothetical protein ABW148_16395 [Sedimenticola sp.]
MHEKQPFTEPIDILKEEQLAALSELGIFSAAHLAALAANPNERHRLARTLQLSTRELEELLHTLLPESQIPQDDFVEPRATGLTPPGVTDDEKPDASE